MFVLLNHLAFYIGWMALAAVAVVLVLGLGTVCLILLLEGYRRVTGKLRRLAAR